MSRYSRNHRIFPRRSGNPVSAHPTIVVYLSCFPLFSLAVVRGSADGHGSSTALPRRTLRRTAKILLISPTLWRAAHSSSTASRHAALCCEPPLPQCSVVYFDRLATARFQTWAYCIHAAHLVEQEGVFKRRIPCSVLLNSPVSDLGNFTLSSLVAPTFCSPSSSCSGRHTTRKGNCGWQSRA